MTAVTSAHRNFKKKLQLLHFYVKSILLNFSNDSWAWCKFDGEVSIVELIKQYAI